MRQKIVFSNRACRGYCTLLWLLAVGLICLNNYSMAPSISAEVSRKIKSTGAGINGSIHFSLPQQVGKRALSGRKSSRRINLVGFKVYLKNVETGEESPPEVTDHYGRYMFPRQKPGKYELRWKQQAGWAEGHYPEKLEIESTTLYPTAAEVTPLPHMAVLVGKVKLADGTSPFFTDEFFGVEQAAQVEVLDNNKTIVGQPVEVNSVGEFAIAGLSRTNVRVRAMSQRAGVEQPVRSSALFIGGPVQPISLILPNRRPQIKNIFAKARGRALIAAKYGQTVNISVSVEDQDHDQLKIVCRGQDGAGTVVPSGINNWTWKLPQVGGSKTVFILASDNKGGFATANLSLNVGSKIKAAPAEVRLVRSNDLLLNAPGPNPIPSPGLEFLTLKRPGSADLANNYYKGVDPDKERLTLGAWWAKNGFDNHGDAQGAVRTSYLNNNDLGSGRDMHVLRHDDGTVSAYVTNYGGFDQDSHNADLAASQTSPGATVCMEYSPIEHQDNTRRVVKFFVYLGGIESAPRVNNAQLDGNPPKFVPNLCLNCHGGNYRISTTATPTLDDLDMSASFREFDLTTFKYPGGRETPNQAEQDAFKRQNLLIKGSDTPQNDPDNSYHITQPAIKNLIDGWYANDSPTQLASFVPVGWSGDSTRLYSEVVAKSCRTCHIALETEPRTKGISWISFDEFLHRRDDIINAICGDIIMPHANFTFKNFWLSDRPATFASFSTTGWDAVGQCPQ